MLLLHVVQGDSTNRIVWDETRAYDHSTQEALHSLACYWWWYVLYILSTSLIDSEFVLLALIAEELDLVYTKHRLLHFQEHVVLVTASDD